MFEFSPPNWIYLDLPSGRKGEHTDYPICSVWSEQNIFRKIYNRETYWGSRVDPTRAPGQGVNLFRVLGRKYGIRGTVLG